PFSASGSTLAARGVAICPAAAILLVSQVRQRRERPMNHKCRVVVCWLVLAGGQAIAEEPPPGVFRQPQVVPVYARMQAEIHALLQNKDDSGAEKKCREAIRLAPQYPDAHYNLACALARQDKKVAALDSLARAVERGFNNVKHIKEDSDLKSLHEEERFKK